MAGGTVAALKGPGFSWSSVWNPADHWDDIVGWWDASEADTFVLTPDTTLVETWYDMKDVRPLTSPATPRPARNATIGTLPAVAFNSNPANRLEFDGGSDNIDVSTYTFFAVVRLGAVAEFDRIMGMRRSATGAGDAASPNVILGYRDADTDSTWPMVSRPASTKSTAATGSASAFVFHARYDGTNVISGVNGVETAPVVATAPASMRYIRMGSLLASVGNPPNASATGNLNGDIGEVVLINTAIDPAHPVNSYFKPKWGIT